MEKFIKRSWEDTNHEQQNDLSKGVQAFFRVILKGNQISISYRIQKLSTRHFLFFHR